VFSTTAGSVSSSTTANSIRFIENNAAVAAWHRGDSLSGSTWSTTWPDLSGNGVTLTASASGAGSSNIVVLTTLNGLKVPNFNWGLGQYGLSAGGVCSAGNAISIASVVCPTLYTAQQGQAGISTTSGAPSPGVNVNDSTGGNQNGGGSDYSTAATHGSAGTVVSGSCYRMGYVANGGSTFAITGSTMTTGSAGTTGTPSRYEIGAGGTTQPPVYFANGLIAEVAITCSALSQAALQRQLDNFQKTWTGGTPVL
jgi:hypothetical protein